MTNLIDITLELILLGTVDAASSKRTPMLIRIMLGFALLAGFLELFGLILYVGIRAGSIVLCSTAFLVFLSAAVIILSKMKHIRRK